METTHLLQTKSLSCSPSFHHHHRHWRLPPIMPKRKRSPAIVTAVLTPPADPSLAVEETKTAERYKDSWFDRIAIHYLSQSVQSSSGLRNDKGGFESLVEAATAVSRNYDAAKQRELIILSLNKAFPEPILSLISKVMVPKHKFTREFFALFTTLFFAWLVGPCEVRESELNGRREKNVVYIKKCRFLDETNCVGMCTNLCKIPSQSFINDSLGMPVNMVPNFEDMSCQMIFGEQPPPLMEDPALTQPCYKLCRAHIKHHKNCSS